MDNVKIEEFNGIKHYMIDGVLQSINPCSALFGWTYWSKMIPPYKPDSTLILGYGAGTIAQLMDRVHGWCNITGVDLKEYREKDGHEFIKYDAFSFVENTDKKFDYVVIDLFDPSHAPMRIFHEDFIKRLARITGSLLCVHINGEQVKLIESYKPYFDLKSIQQSNGDVIVYWITKNSNLNDKKITP